MSKVDSSVGELRDIKIQKSVSRRSVPSIEISIKRIKGKRAPMNEV